MDSPRFVQKVLADHHLGMQVLIERIYVSYNLDKNNITYYNAEQYTYDINLQEFFSLFCRRKKVRSESHRSSFSIDMVFVGQYLDVS